MEKQDPGTAAALTRKVERGADAAQIADAMVATWQEIDAALRPILGQRGVSSLFKRSLHLTAPAHPWLTGVLENVHTDMGLDALRAMVAQQDSADAASAGDALLHTFHELLASLIGPSLTERLLHSVWANSSSGAPAQDPSP